MVPVFIFLLSFCLALPHCMFENRVSRPSPFVPFHSSGFKRSLESRSRLCGWFGISCRLQMAPCGYGDPPANFFFCFDSAQLTELVSFFPFWPVTPATHLVSDTRPTGMCGQKFTAVTVLWHQIPHRPSGPMYGQHMLVQAADQVSASSCLGLCIRADYLQLNWSVL